MSKPKIIVLIALITALTFLATFFGVSCKLIMDDNESLKSQIQNAQSQIDSTVSEYESQLNEKSSEIDRLNSELSSTRAQLQAQQSPSSGSSEVSQKICYLTFDDGPSENTLKILEILKRENVKATFFVIHTGKMEYLKNIADDGHAIGLHTYSHEYYQIYSSDEAYFNDLQMISDEVFQYTGIRSNIIRFPGGSSNTVSKKYNLGIMTRLTQEVQNRGYTYFDWNVTSGDADDKKLTASEIVQRCKNDMPKRSNACVLMHDAPTKTTTVDALPQVIQLFRDNGFTFETLDSNSVVPKHTVNN